MIRFGIDNLIDTNFAALSGQRVGLFTNLCAVDARLMTTYDIFRTSDAVNLAAIFSPEHGLAGMVADGVKVDSGVDPLTGLPLYSLYGETFRPTADMLAEIDVMVCDIQDIGVRYYTFLWTVTHIIEACGEYGVPVIVLDRPNPLGGDIVRGGGLDAKLASLVGRYDIPIQHGLTMGEATTMINALYNPHPAQITVIRCEGWERAQDWAQIGRPFVPPSPAMPHISTARHYPGSCLIEGTTLSEGRGTSLPFEVVGAPDVDSTATADALNALNLAGMRFRPYRFQPTASKHAGVACGGVQVHITDAARFDALAGWLAVLGVMRPHYEWKEAHFDRLIGDTETRAMIDAGEPVDAIIGRWAGFLDDFAHKRRDYLLY